MTHPKRGEIYLSVLAEAMTVLYDDRLLSEYRAVLMRPAFGFPRASRGAPRH